MIRFVTIKKRTRKCLVHVLYASDGRPTFAFKPEADAVDEISGVCSETHVKKQSYMRHDCNSLQTEAGRFLEVIYFILFFGVVIDVFSGLCNIELYIGTFWSCLAS